MFNKARDENAQQADAEKKKLEKEALKEQAAANSSAKREHTDSDTPKDIKAMIRDRSEVIIYGKNFIVFKCKNMFLTTMEIDIGRTALNFPLNFISNISI